VDRGILFSAVEDPNIPMAPLALAA